MKLLACLLLPSAASALLSLCAFPSTYKPTLSENCTSSAWSSPALSLVAARGELESGVLLLSATAPTVAACPAVQWAAGSAPAGVAATVSFLTYMHTEASPRYAGSRAGWFAEALLPWPAAGVGVAAGANAAAWVTFSIGADAAPGTYAGTLSAAGASMPFSLQVFALALPPLGASPFKTIYAFDASILKRAYGASAGYNDSATQSHYWQALAASRFPATNIYATKPLSLSEYAELAALGSNVLILADISALPGGYQRAGRGGRAAAAAPAPADCPTFSPAYIAAMVELLNSTWVGLQSLGLSHLATVYGFDEIDASCEPSVRALFAAAKAAFPGVRTLSAIDWPTVPLDLPLDIWILQYQLVNPAVAGPWITAGHELGVYHCIEPSGPGYMNTFIERDLIEARLLFWYDYVLGVSSHLYYDVALWENWASVPPFWASYTTVSGVTHPQGLVPLAVPPSPADPRLLSWDPAVWIWAPRTDIWASGDGVYIYPGELSSEGVGAVVSTVRLEAQRDGVEDWHIFTAAAAAKGQGAVMALVREMVTGPRAFSNNCTLLQEVKAAVLALCA